jgi:hypothetical protein
MSENIHHLSGNLLVGSSHFFVDTTNNRVGITTADPDAGLHVNSNAYVHTDFRVGSGIAMNVTGGRITAGSFEGDGSLLSGVNSDSGSWVNGTNSNVHLATSTNKVGIGRNNPACALDIAGEDVMIRGNTPSLNFSEGTGAMDAAFRIRYDGANKNDNNNFLAIQTGANFGLTALHAKYDGHVGIGTTSPETALHVNGSITLGDQGPYSVTYTDAQLILGGTHNQGYNRGNYVKLLISGGNNDSSSPFYIMCEDENGYDQFYVKGATSDNGGTAILYIKGQVKMASAGDTYAFIPGNDGWLRLQGSASGQGNMWSSYTSLAVGNFWSAGNTRFSSDDRVKHFEEEVPALDLIRQLKPYKYKKTSKIYTEDYTGEIGEEGKDWEWEIGLIAQDIEKIPYLEFAVSKPEDSPEKDKYGLNYTQFIGVCIQGIKKLDEELQTTKADLQTTRTELADLKERLNTHTHPLEEHTHPLEEHTHPLEEHTHPLEEHTHPLEPHTHPLEPHTHPLEPHTHPLEEHTHPDLVDQLTIEKAKTRELQQRLTLIEHSHAALVARLVALENM